MTQHSSRDLILYDPCEKNLNFYTRVSFLNNDTKKQLNYNPKLQFFICSKKNYFYFKLSKYMTDNFP